VDVDVDVVDAGLLDERGMPVSPQRVVEVVGSGAVVGGAGEEQQRGGEGGKAARRGVYFADECEMHDGETTRVMACKTHDGLTLRRQVLDALVTHYFVNQREVSELHVLETCKTLQAIKELETDLADLRQRIELGALDGKLSVPVLPEGGGACTKLAPPHAPYINVLLQVIEAAYVRLSNAMELS
jgi:hypothetical protein